MEWSQIPARPFLTTPEVCELLNVSQATVKRLLYDGLISGHKAPTRWIISRASLLSYLDVQAAVPPVPPLTKNTYSLTEVGKRWGFYRSRITHLVQSGQLKVKEIRNSQRVTREELERWENV